MAAKKTKSIPVKQTVTKASPDAADDKYATDRTKWVLAAILGFTALLYLKAIYNGFTFMDDDFYILNNPYIRNFSWQGVEAIFTSFYNYNYHPLTTITDLLIYRWFGLDPLPYHFLNVALHVLNVWLVYMLAKRLSGKKITGLVVAVLFAVHPLHVESVAWVSERKDVLYTTFYLLATIVYLRYLSGGQQPKYYLLALFLFLASLFSKSAAVTLPLLLVAIDVYKGRRINIRSLLEKTPFFLLSILLGILAIKSQASGGAISDISNYFNFTSRFFLFTSGIAFYVIKLILPVNLNGLHFYPETMPFYYYLSLPFLLLLVWLATRKHTYRKEVIFGTGFFLITICVMLQIVPVGASFVAERYTYVPYIGLFYLAGQWISDRRAQQRKIIIPVFSVVAILFAIISWVRIDVWKDTDTLFTDIIAKNPNNWRDGMVYNSWGDYEKYNGDNAAALQKYAEAISLYPLFPLAWYNKALTEQQAGNIKSAINDFNEAIKLTPTKASYYNSRGWAYYQSGNKQAAMLDYSKALSLNPNFPEAYNNRGWGWYESGDIKSALSDFSKAIALAPGFTKPYYNRAAIKINSGDLDGAVADYNSVIKYNPGEGMAYFNRGIVYMKQKDMRNACADWNKSQDLGYKDAAVMLQQYCH